METGDRHPVRSAELAAKTLKGRTVAAQPGTAFGDIVNQTTDQPPEFPPMVRFDQMGAFMGDDVVSDSEWRERQSPGQSDTADTPRSRR